MTNDSVLSYPASRLIVATKALEQVTSAEGFILQMLYMSALDAQFQEKTELGFKVLRHYNDEWITEEAKNEIILPVLFRCPPHPCRCLHQVFDST